MLNLPSVSTNDSGNYQLIALSGTKVFKGPLITITVEPPPVPPIPPTLSISSPSLDLLILTVGVSDSHSVVVESSADLTNWEPFSTLTESGTISIQADGQPSQFYRARSQ
jgi:hypothetical protein